MSRWCTVTLRQILVRVVRQNRAEGVFVGELALLDQCAIATAVNILPIEAMLNLVSIRFGAFQVRLASPDALGRSVCHPWRPGPRRKRHLLQPVS